MVMKDTMQSPHSLPFTSQVSQSMIMLATLERGSDIVVSGSVAALCHRSDVPWTP